VIDWNLGGKPATATAPKPVAVAPKTPVKASKPPPSSPTEDPEDDDLDALAAVADIQEAERVANEKAEQNKPVKTLEAEGEDPVASTVEGQETPNSNDKKA
jgi:hypothetical protein